MNEPRPLLAQLRVATRSQSSLAMYRPAVPPPQYLCHLCFQHGHYIDQCTQAHGRSTGATPYQGMMRCFGEFHCSRCDRQWVSGNSWANTGQECIVCNAMVYPHRQKPLENPGNVSVRRREIPHRQELCQKCKELGTYCKRSK